MVGPERYEAEAGTGTASGSWGGPQSCEAVVGFGDDSESSEAGCGDGPGDGPGSQDGLDCESAAGDRPQPSNYEPVAEIDSCEPAPGAVTGAGLVVENHELAAMAGGGSCETGVGPWAESYEPESSEAEAGPGPGAEGGTSVATDEAGHPRPAYWHQDFQSQERKLKRDEI